MGSATICDNEYDINEQSKNTRSRMKNLPGSIIVLAIVMLCGLTVVAQEQQKAALEQPILITSAGQSADVKLVGMLAKQQKLDAKVVGMAKSADLEGVKTLVIVPGFSSKGLGAAGVSQKDEMDRVVALVAAAKEKKIPIVTVHIGGSARRGGQSDDFCKVAATDSERLVVVAQGDEDKYFTKIAEAKKIPIDVVVKIADVATPLGQIFKK